MVLDWSLLLNAIFVVIITYQWWASRIQTAPQPQKQAPIKQPAPAGAALRERPGCSRIGLIYTPFRRKSGCPRQPSVGKTCRSIIKLDKEMDVCLLQGLEEWSYIWLLWDFDKRVLPGNGSIKSLVQPPRAPTKVGVFACRTPHRPIALGLSLVKLIKVEGKKVYIEGSDVVHNTTLLDIKPYHHTADSPWDDDIRQPSWVGSASEKAFAKTTIIPEVKDKISKACKDGKLQFWKGEDDLESLFFSISDLVCNQDMRSQWRRGSQVRFVMDFDNLLLTLNYEGDEVTITEVEVNKNLKYYDDAKAPENAV